MYLVWKIKYLNNTQKKFQKWKSLKDPQIFRVNHTVQDSDVEWKTKSLIIYFTWEKVNVF